MNRVEKTEFVDSLHEAFTGSGGVILLSFQGLKVPDVTELRRRIRAADSSYKVVKNTLALIAAEGTPLSGLRDQFSGPTAVAYTQRDAVALAKVLKEFAKTNQGVSFKGGVVDGRVISQEQVVELADLPSREALLSKVLFLLNAPLTRLAMALKSPVRNLAIVLKQLEEKK